MNDPTPSENRRQPPVLAFAVIFIVLIIAGVLYGVIAGKQTAHDVRTTPVATDRPLPFESAPATTKP